MELFIYDKIDFNLMKFFKCNDDDDIDILYHEHPLLIQTTELQCLLEENHIILMLDNKSKKFLKNLDQFILEKCRENMELWFFDKKGLKYKTIIKGTHENMIKLEITKNTMIFDENGCISKKINNGNIKLIMEVICISSKNNTIETVIRPYQIKMIGNNVVTRKKLYELLDNSDSESVEVYNSDDFMETSEDAEWLE